jgi:hypothetical protein
MPERPNKPHYYPHGNKNKESPLTPSSRISAVSQSILEPTLRARIATACSTTPVLPCLHRRAAMPLHYARPPPPAFLSLHRL